MKNDIKLTPFTKFMVGAAATLMVTIVVSLLVLIMLLVWAGIITVFAIF